MGEAQSRARRAGVVVLTLGIAYLALAVIVGLYALSAARPARRSDPLAGDGS